MKIYSRSVSNGYLGDQFGRYGAQVLAGTSIVNRSFHLSWSDLPPNTKSLALIFIDHDSIPVCGFSWIHWTVANIDPSTNELPENASVEMDLLEGATSFSAPIAPEEWRVTQEQATGYGGCAPPDKDHGYTIKLYALDCKLNLIRGFYTNELINAMEGNVLDRASMKVFYRAG